MTESQFESLKMMIKDDMNALQIKNELNVELIEVNKGIKTRDYDWYVEHR